MGYKVIFEGSIPVDAIEVETDEGATHVDNDGVKSIYIHARNKEDAIKIAAKGFERIWGTVFN